MMRVLIVESNAALGTIWKRHLERQGQSVDLVADQPAAIAHIQRQSPDILVVNLTLTNGSALAIADFASYRAPRARVIFVTSGSFFSDGSIFAHVPNACAFLPTGVPPDDLAALVAHYGVLSISPVRVFP